MRQRLVVFGIAAVAASQGCTSFGAAGDDAGIVDASFDASPDAAVADEAGNGCQGLHGSIAVRFGSFCIDKTEVTRAQYTQFLKEKVSDFTNQPPGCETNGSYTPAREWPSTPADDARPVVGVDWCDAYAFCKWAGKRLCGRIGGGTLARGDHANATRSEWYLVCAATVGRRFPYGKAYGPTTCNGADNHPAAQQVDDVGSHPGCADPSGVLDMSGNVYEWEDACDSTASDALCELRGGDYSTLEAQLTCDTDGNQKRNDNARWGIRCCSN